MNVKNFRVAQFRAFEEAEFEFHPTMNLLVGLNGAGKSTVLDGLRVLLSQIVADLSTERVRKIRFNSEDITIGHESLDLALACQVDGATFSYTVHQPRVLSEPEEAPAGTVRVGTRKIPVQTEWISDPGQAADARTLAAGLRERKEQPLAVYFSAHRSLPNRSLPDRIAFRSVASQASSAGGARLPVPQEALAERSLDLREFAEWLQAREALAGEGLPSARHQVEALNEAAGVFLDTCRNLRVGEGTSGRPTLFVDKGDMPMEVRRLSDGERGVLTLALDLTRRLAEANPGSDDPTREGEAIVLIDELDLHLHPKWQRTIVERLERTFPRCQFIATTHSPQIVSEVQPDRMFWLERAAGRVRVSRKAQAFGLDTNWILEHLMEVPARPLETQAKLDAIEEALEEGALDAARERLAELRGLLHGDDGEVARLEASINNLDFLADEPADEGDMDALDTEAVGAARSNGVAG